jgi:hypothetical protein
MKLSLVKAATDPNLFGTALGDLSSWFAWITWMKAISGEKLSEKLKCPLTGKTELEIFKECCGDRDPPTKPVKRAACICGRRSGKSRVASLVSTWKATCTNFAPNLAAGEVAVNINISPDRQQSRLVFEYIRGFLHSNPMFQQMVEHETRERIVLSTRCEIQILTASSRSSRGRAIPAAIFDESAFLFQSGYATSDTELARAIWPSMIQFENPLLLLISSPYAKSGLLWEWYSKYYGKNEEGVLIWQAPSITMNPLLNQEAIAQDLIEDAEGSESEWLGRFRKSLSMHLNPEVVDDAVVPGRYELEFQPNTLYSAFVDVSGGTRDSMTLAICHKEHSSDGESLVLDLVREVVPDPKFDPAAVAKDFCKELARYHISDITGDRYAAQWCVSAFENEGVHYNPSVQSKSEIYLLVEPLFNTGRVQLLDHKKMVAQFKMLERKVRSGGKDLVDAPGNRPEDIANAVAGALVLANSSSVGRIRTYDWIKHTRK